MTDQMTRDLGREVAEKVGWVAVRIDNPNRDEYAPPHWFLSRNGELITGHDSARNAEEAWGNQCPDYPHDLNACARDLVREGYKFHLEQLDSGLWCGYYTEDGELFAKLIGWNKDANSAVAWCEAFLALKSYVAAIS